MAMDLSKSYNPLTRSHAEAMDLAKKPEWYHRRPPSCSTDLASSYRPRASSSYGSLSTQPGAPMRCRDMEDSPESLGGYMNSTLAPGLDLYHDGVHGGLWHPGFYGPEQSGGPVPESSGGEESDSGSDVIFLVSSAKEPLLCGSFIQDGVTHMVEPLSPAASSLDEERGCYHLPQPLSSPSPDSSYSEDSSDSSVDIPVHHTRPVVLLSDLGAVYSNPAESAVDISSDDSDVIEVSVTEQKNKNNCYQKTSPPHSESEKAPQREVRRSARIRKPVSEILPFTYSVSRHSLSRRAKHDAVGIYNESCDSDDVMDYALRLSSSDESPVKSPQRVSCNSEESDADVQMDRKSPEREKQQQQQPSNAKSINRKQKKPLVAPKTKKLRRTNQKQNCRIPPPHPKSSACRGAVANKQTVTRRRRKLCRQTGPSPLFSPREPEIKLKYLNAKEDKKEKKSHAFCPFVHMERQACTVVNYQEEEATVRSSGGGQRAACRTLSGFVPNTSCFHPGRLSSESRSESSLFCCLCGHTANVMGLGDLHGPYYPSVDGQKEELNGLYKSSLVNSSDDSGTADGNAPLKVSLHLNECWIHEDCGIWSAGIFLIRGKLYGLEEAARLAQETICATCQQTGAIMGCFQKGCPRDYHYRCAIQSGCVLNEENFSMRCPEHKNKAFTSATRRQKR